VAEKKGFRPGDIITEVNQKSINTPNNFVMPSSQPTQNEASSLTSSRGVRANLPFSSKTVISLIEPESYE